MHNKLCIVSRKNYASYAVMQFRADELKVRHLGSCVKASCCDNVTRDFSIRPESPKAPGVLLARAERSCSSSRFGECGHEGLCPEASKRCGSSSAQGETEAQRVHTAQAKHRDDGGFQDDGRGQSMEGVDQRVRVLAGTSFELSCPSCGGLVNYQPK